MCGTGAQVTGKPAQKQWGSAFLENRGCGKESGKRAQDGPLGDGEKRTVHKGTENRRRNIPRQ